MRGFHSTSTHLTARRRRLLAIALAVFSGGCAGKGVSGIEHPIATHPVSVANPAPASMAVQQTVTPAQVNPPQAPIELAPIEPVDFESLLQQGEESISLAPEVTTAGGPAGDDATGSSTSAQSESAQSESPQSVDHYVSLALAGHPSILAARNRVAAEANRIEQVSSLPDPTFSNMFWPIHDQSLQTAAGRVGNQMSLSQAIPWPEKLDAKAAVVRREVQIARAEVQQIEREVAESVRLAYYELWYANRSIEILQATQELVDQLTTVAETRYRAGGTQQDVLRAQLEADRLEDQLVRLRQQKQAAQADLAALVQQPAQLLPETEADLGISNVPGQLDELIARAESCNPKLAGLSWEIERDRQKQRLACLQQYPDLQVGLNWGLVNDNTNVLSPVANGHDQISFNVGTTLPIWRGKINAGVREAAQQTSSSVHRFDAQRNALYGELRRILSQADAFSQQREIYKDRMIPRVEDTLTLTIADYRGKRADFFTVIETYRELLMFETQLARIEASLAGTLARLHRAVGCP